MCHDVQTIRQVNNTTNTNVTGSVLGRRELTFKRSYASNKPSADASTPSKKPKLVNNTSDTKQGYSDENIDHDASKMLRRKQRQYKKALMELRDLEEKVKLEMEKSDKLEEEGFESLQQLEEEFKAEREAVLAQIETVDNLIFELSEKELLSE